MNRSVLFFILFSSIFSNTFSQQKTSFSNTTGEYGQLLKDLERAMLKDRAMKSEVIAGKKRTAFGPWIRDHVHVMKAMKYIHPDMVSFIELYLENQTEEGLYFDYYLPLNASGISKRKELFDQRYWKEFPEYNIEMHRLPVEADLEYLLVEGVYAVWQATGDTTLVEKWLPTLVKGMHYSMRDTLRWSRKHQLVKRGYTMDTWGFMQLPVSREQYTKMGGDVQKGIFDIDEYTPMGIMHGDNSGMFAACNQLSEMFKVVGNNLQQSSWKRQAEHFRMRTNSACWNGKFYAHFIEDDPQPEYLNRDQKNTLSMSNLYDINRDLPTGRMAQSIIQTYLDLKENNKKKSFAEWYGIYPPVASHFGDYKPGSYMNGGVNTIVAGELAKAAFQHGYEHYGVDILKRIIALMKKHKGNLPAAYTPKGKVDEGIPDNRGQAALYSALIEGLAGVVDKGTGFNTVEISPRWMAAGKDKADVNVAYPAGDATLSYSYSHSPQKKTIAFHLRGDVEKGTVRILLPSKARLPAKAFVNKKPIESETEKVKASHYVVIKGLSGKQVLVEVKY